MAIALRRAKLLDTAVVSFLLIVLSVVHFSLLKSGRSKPFTKASNRSIYQALLVASWPILAIGATPILMFWFVGRSADRAHFSSASSVQLLIVMAMATLIALGCLLLAVAEIIWVADIGFHKFDIILVLGIISFVLLIWIAFQIFSVVREASAVRKHMAEARNMPQPTGGNMDAMNEFGAYESDPEMGNNNNGRPADRNDPFS